MNSSDEFWLVDSRYSVRYAKEVLKSANVYIPFQSSILNKKQKTSGKKPESNRKIANVYIPFKSSILNKVMAQDGPIEILRLILVG